MKGLTKTKMTPMEKLRGGNGVVFVSENIEVEDAILSTMFLPDGASIGMHTHEGNITEVYHVIRGGVPLINGKRTKVAVCNPGESHDLVNDTGDWITVLSTKTS